MHHQSLMQRFASDEHGARDVQQIFFESDVLLLDEIGIGQIDGEHAIVVGQVGSE